MTYSLSDIYEYEQLVKEEVVTNYVRQYIHLMNVKEVIYFNNYKELDEYKNRELEIFRLQEKSLSQILEELKIIKQNECLLYSKDIMENTTNKAVLINENVVNQEKYIYNFETVLYLNLSPIGSKLFGNSGINLSISEACNICLDACDEAYGTIKENSKVLLKK